MNARSLRRLAADHSALRSQPLPPNYLFPPSSANEDDLTQLDILLAGPSHTPFQGGLFKLHLTIPPTYPQNPPTAHFRTPIFHPMSSLRPEAALNAEAGSLIHEDYAAFSRRAELMTGIHAAVPRGLREAVEEARRRGQIVEEEARVEEKVEIRDFAGEPAAPGRRRRLGGTARQRGTVGRRSEGSPTGMPARRRQGPTSQQPFVLQSRSDDVFGEDNLRLSTASVSENDSIQDADQENDETRSPGKAPTLTPKAATPRRPHGPPIPLGDLSIEEASSSDEEDMELEYPPSPRKSPRKSPTKPQRRPETLEQPESSRDALRRALASNVTPPSNLIDQPLAEGSPFTVAGPRTSPRNTRTQRAVTPTSRPPKKFEGGLVDVSTPRSAGGDRVMKSRSPSSSERKRKEGQRKADLGAQLWDLCGRDIGRWNRGDFDGEPFAKKAARW